MNEDIKKELIYTTGIVVVFLMFFATIIYGIKSGNEKQIKIMEIQTYGETLEKE